jgi:hypothetical protein
MIFKIRYLPFIFIIFFMIMCISGYWLLPAAEQHSQYVTNLCAFLSIFIRIDTREYFLNPIKYSMIICIMIALVLNQCIAYYAALNEMGY